VGEVAAVFAKYFADTAWCADRILCISKCTRNDLTELLDKLGAPKPELSVLTLGCEVPGREDGEISSDVADLLDKRYILYVSTLERRKNHKVLYQAYTSLVDQGHTDLPLLVFVGMPGWGVNDLLADLKLDYRIKPYLRLLSHLNDADLARLYTKAHFIVYPSLYEGWGLPVAESLAFGKFCLVSNAASLPEVGGELVEYIDPLNIPGWAERILWYHEHPEAVKTWETKISREYDPPRWRDSASSIIQSAASLLG
jgi:glycosyltransferase involved in cell wall biosynthesis